MCGCLSVPWDSLEGAWCGFEGVLSHCPSASQARNHGENRLSQRDTMWDTWDTLGQGGVDGGGGVMFALARPS